MMHQKSTRCINNQNDALTMDMMNRQSKWYIDNENDSSTIDTMHQQSKWFINNLHDASTIEMMHQQSQWCIYNRNDPSKIEMMHWQSTGWTRRGDKSGALTTLTRHSNTMTRFLLSPIPKGSESIVFLFVKKKMVSEIHFFHGIYISSIFWRISDSWTTLTEKMSASLGVCLDFFFSFFF